MSQLNSPTTLNVQVKVHTFTRDLTLASGDVSITGIGFRPRAVIILARSNVGSNSKPTSLGFCDLLLNSMCLQHRGSNTNSQFNADTSNVIVLEELANVDQKALLKSMDSDGYTLTWTKTGNPSASTGTMVCLALG